MRTGKVGGRQLRSSMPWYFYGKTTDDELKAVFVFLQALKPVDHRVDNLEARAIVACAGNDTVLGIRTDGVSPHK